jgi:hypothetical protein
VCKTYPHILFQHTLLRIGSERRGTKRLVYSSVIIRNLNVLYVWVSVRFLRTLGVVTVRSDKSYSLRTASIIKSFISMLVWSSITFQYLRSSWYSFLAFKASPISLLISMWFASGSKKFFSINLFYRSWFLDWLVAQSSNKRMWILRTTIKIIIHTSSNHQWDYLW